MNAYLNEFSLTSAVKGDALALAENFIELTESLIADYDLRTIKAPAGFKSLTIAGDRSFSQLVQSDGEVPFNKMLSIIGFLANRVSEIHSEIDEAIGVQLENKSAWSSVKLNGLPSYTLTGAYLMKRPAISFPTATHTVDFLNARFHLEYDKKDAKEKEISIENIHDANSLQTHHDFLINCKREETFKPHRWRPDDLPIWNPRTFEVLEQLEFPQRIEGNGSAIAELQNVGRLIATLNSWRHDDRLSKINTNKNQIRDIFVSVGGRGTWYLSTDVKNYKGTFEVCDREGRHEGQISFTTGKFIPRGHDNLKGRYDDGTHNIKLRR